MRQLVLFHVLPRASKLVAAILILLSSLCQAQFQRFGLKGDTVFSIREYGMRLYAGTQRGAFVLDLFSADSTWKAIGLTGKRVRAIYPHDYGPIGYAVTAGIEHPIGDPDSALTYCTFNSDTAWAPTDTGMDRTRFRYVGSADGFPSPLICGETFVTTGTTLYRRGGPVWEPVLDMGVSKLNVVRTRETGLTTGMVFVGGETAIFAPYIKFSGDKGESWGDATVPYHGDDACYAFAFDPADTSTMYAGMEGSVLVSTDRGKSWAASGLSGTPFYFFALAADFVSTYAGGAASVGPGHFGLYRSIDKGDNWLPISITDSLGGVLSLEMIPTAIPEVNALVIGTMGSGVLLYTGPPVSAPPSPTPVAFKLDQNYPNPFNLSTLIRYSIPESGEYGVGSMETTLAIYDLLGRQVVVLVNERKAPGRYEVAFDASGLSSGVYIYRLTAGQYTQSRQMVLLK